MTDRKRLPSLAFFLLPFASATPPLLAVDTLTVSSPEPLFEDWRWTTFDEQSGVAGEVEDLIEDPDGSIWFATHAGLQRYDGLTWETYPDLVLKGFGWLGDNTLTTAADSGMILIDLEGLRAGRQAVTAIPWPKQEALGFGSDQQTIGGGGGRAWDGTIWNALSTGDRLDPDRGVGAIHKLHEGSWEKVGLPGVPDDIPIADLSTTSDGSVWIWTYGHGVFVNTRGRWHQYGEENGVPSGMVMRMSEAPDGTLWFSRWGQPPIRFSDGRFRVSPLSAHTMHSVWYLEGGTYLGVDFGGRLPVQWG